MLLQTTSALFCTFPDCLGCVWREGDRVRGIDIAEREKFKVRVFFMDVVEFNWEYNGQVRNFTYQRVVFFLAL